MGNSAGTHRSDDDGGGTAKIQSHRSGQASDLGPRQVAVINDSRTGKQKVVEY